MIDKESIINSLEFKTILDELWETWHQEQSHRRKFWSKANEDIKAEFILGKAVYTEPPMGRHWMASTSLATLLLPHVYDNNLGRVSLEKVMIRLTRNDYEPDICFWNKERTLDFEPTQSAFPAPNFIVEILSDSTKKRDYGIKKTDYALHGVEEYWIIDPINETVEQYLLRGITYELSQKLREGSITSEVITGFTIDVKAIFRQG